MKAKTLIALAVMVVLAMMVLPALAQSRLLTTSTASSAAAINLPAPAKLPNAARGSGDAKPIDPNGIDRLINATGGSIRVSVSRATGAVRFITLPFDRQGELSRLLGADKAPQAQADEFFKQYGSLFGIKDAAAELKLIGRRTDDLGTTRLEYRQVYRGVPVFAGLMLVHFDAKNQLTAINGVFVPDVAIDATPKLSAAQAAKIAVDLVGPTGIAARKTTLVVYRTGLAQGVAGYSALVYEVEAGNGVNVREFVYVDAHTGKIVDRVSAIEDGLTRRVYSGTYTTTAIVWQEGNVFPFTGVFSADINSIISATGESYNLFSSAFARDSYDTAGHVMETVNNDPTIACPNANWNGVTTNYCNGVTSDDVVAHEWGHAYTEYTHNLIYAWQPGALNESYSDIWGETVDLLNGRQTDVPGGPRTAGACSTYIRLPGRLIVSSPISITGFYTAQAAAFGPYLTTPGVTGTVALAQDAVGSSIPGDPALSIYDACEPLVNGAQISGKIALTYRGTCNFTVKVKNAQDAGAIGVIVANRNNAPGLPGMGGSDATIVIPSLGVSFADGELIRTELSNTVTATLTVDPGVIPPDNSYRWLMGEDSTAFGGAIRDMWNPTCFGDPGKVTDVGYYCAADDGGGVHTNSGVPNHTYALIVDGGSYNGYTITGISMTKAAHLYYRAQSVYQVPTTDFADHADALLASCNDLVAAGANLPALSTSISTTVLSGQVFTTTDCVQVTTAISATQLRTPPTQCNFQPLLNPNAPALCAAGTGSAITVFTDTFEIASGWTVSHTDVFSTTALEWLRVGGLPGARPGQAFFATDDQSIGQCTGGPGDASRVMYLASPLITLPSTTTVSRLAFDHWMASEFGWDGGNLQISVNGGPWQNVATANFTFNPYNATINTAGAGNTNPLAGTQGFTGSDGGQVTGSWGRSLVKISDYASAGDTIRLRYRFGTDGCGGLIGWYVDDVQVYYCSADQNAQIALAPTSMSSTQKQNAVVTKTLTISNTGTTDLNWTLNESPVLKPVSNASRALSPLELLAARKSSTVVSGRPSTERYETNAPLANVVQDGGFEATVSFFNPFWNEFSEQFGSPICNASCGGPVLSGVWDVWLGGAGTNNPDPESGFVSQVITIPSGGAQLGFLLGAASSPTATASFSVTLDNTVLFTLTQLTANQYNTVTLISLNVSNFANGGAHTLRFGEADAANDGNFNVFVDNVSVDTAPCYIGGSLPWLSTSPVSGTTTPGTATPVNVTFNATGLASGIYTGTLCIASNDASDPTKNVAVSMTVEQYKIYLPLIRK